MFETKVDGFELISNERIAGLRYHGEDSTMVLEFSDGTYSKVNQWEKIHLYVEEQTKWKSVGGVCMDETGGRVSYLYTRRSFFLNMHSRARRSLSFSVLKMLTEEI